MKVFTLLFLLTLAHKHAQTTFSDDFEAYNNNAYLAASSSVWTTWSNAPGTSEDVKISTDFAKSETKSVKIINTAYDVTTLEVSLDKSSKVEMEILDVSGEVLSYKNYGVLQGEMQLPINLFLLNKGMYFIKVKTDVGNRIQKLLVH